jgi:hypothetical protein
MDTERLEIGFSMDAHAPAKRNVLSRYPQRMNPVQRAKRALMTQSSETSVSRQKYVILILDSLFCVGTAIILVI